VRIGMTVPFADFRRDDFLEWCRRIDDGPFSTLAFGERIAYPNYDLVAALAAAAAVTTRVGIVATIAVLPLHRTIPFAKQAATIDAISNGRLTLGLGIGGRDEDYRAADASTARRHQRLDEQVALLRRVWAGEAPMPGMAPVGPAPVQPGGPPLLTGGMGPKAIARAARWADGLAGFELGPDPDAVRATFHLVEHAWEQAERAEPPVLTTSSWYALGPDATQRLRGYATRYLDFLGAETAGALAAMCRIDADDALRDTLKMVEDAGADEFVLVPVSGDLDQLARAIEVVAAHG
jgi:alkanesulfonate monooxygenase SsuD/methylene tetrahydromethanopterin reductase-like flavin-dependent oxidoreductase (luciferase family)